MGLTLKSLAREIHHALGRDPHSDLTSENLVNEAGQVLTTIHSWKWLQDTSETLGFTSGQNFVNLPANTLDIIVLTTTEGLITSLELTSLKDLVRRRTETVTVPRHYWAAVEHLQAAGAAPVPRLALHPTPDSTDASALTILARKGWSVLADEDTLAAVPVWFEPLLVEWVRAYALGKDDDSSPPLSQMLEEVATGALFEAAKRTDHKIQGTTGRLKNGMAQSDNAGDSYFYWRDRSVGAPS